MYWKEYFNRARPSSISAKLMPPIDPPGHASFPSGHATQAHLVARLLWEVMPKQIVPADKFKEGPLYLMAERIGRNREVLGLHYRSDTLAGEALAEHITTKILLDRRATKAAALIDAAKTEWVR
jgi:membrane-associated phospholipid phosphatase